MLVGPSGCGKSTALRMVAGLEDISTGTLKIGDRVVNTLSPKDRDIAMVFQSYALYPHMTVGDNIGYGLKIRKMDKAEIQRRVKNAADMLELDPAAGPQAEATLRWPAATGGDGSGDRPRAAGVPDGRAAVQPRRQAARADARRDRTGTAGSQRHHPLRHPRPGRGDDDGGPGRGAQGRAADAGRRAAVPLRQPGQRLRRRLHRLAADEHGHGTHRPRRRRLHRDAGQLHPDPRPGAHRGEARAEEPRR